MRRVAILPALLLAAGAALAAAVPVQAATSPVAGAVCPDWSLRGATGQYPSIVFGEAPDGARVVSPNKVILAKPTEGVMPGVEFAAFDLDLALPEPQAITVDFALSAEASHAATAIRLFYYHQQGADTINDAPAGFVAATSDAGTLTLAADGTVGTIGLVYDASNSAVGTVTFTDLRIGNTKVKFAEHDKCSTPEPTPTATPTATAVPTVSPTATAVATVSPAATPPGGYDGGAGERTLPITGARTGAIVAAAAGLLVVGAGLWLLARRRRVRFQA